ncbi:X8 domain-containing protein [Abeliophyllum distichum]|uniref:X8 domain-containing protein n=1 Tax=Abeliophyllum distichum TaxID=126358 RepID=A0ABD1SVP3_9LAMI
MAAAAVLLKVLVVAALVFNFSASMVAAATWCVSRSDASDQALQIAIDYACGTGADCAPIQGTKQGDSELTEEEDGQLRGHRGQRSSRRIATGSGFRRRKNWWAKLGH